MPYLVFALKWRPKVFDEVIGQPGVINTLKSAIQKDRLAHAYLFSGPRGVGKTSVARILAKALNCSQRKGVNPCGKCPACVDISQGRSLDVIEIDGASNRGIDEIRALRENVKFSPVNGKYKVYIIDEVHQITPEGFNALLKTLEEPPEFVKFIFATTHPQKVMPTILSRCQRLDFRRISVMEIITQLENISSSEKIDTDKEVLAAIARSSDGSLRDAESVLDQLISFAKDKISLADIVSMLGMVEQDMLFAVTDKIIHKDARGVLDLLDEMINQGKDVSMLLQSLIEHFRNLMVAKVARGDSRLIDLPEDICKRLSAQSGDLSLEEIFSAFNILVNTQEVARRIESLRIPLEIGLVKLAHDKKGARVETAPSKHPPHTQQIKPDTLKNDSVLPIPVEIKKNPDKPDGPAPEEKIISLDMIKGVWNNIIENMSRVKMSAATYLNEGSLVKLENNTLTIAFPVDYSLHKESLERKENKAIIEKIIDGVLNADLRVDFILTKEKARGEDSADERFLKNVLHTFEGRVIRGD
ncbi:MAG: DNA polymerase III subunit gamma/tau [Candidatus Omnitrophota bacterium]